MKINVVKYALRQAIKQARRERKANRNKSYNYETINNKNNKTNSTEIEFSSTMFLIIFTIGIFAPFLFIWFITKSITSSIIIYAILFILVGIFAR